MSASSLDDKWFQLVSYKYILHRLKAQTETQLPIQSQSVERFEFFSVMNIRPLQHSTLSREV